MDAIEYQLRSIRRLFWGWLGKPYAPMADDDDRQVILEPRVMAVTYDPVVEPGGLTLSRHKGWQDVNELLKGYIADIENCSGGLVKYKVVERVNFDKFPLKIDGFCYDANSYLEVIEKLRNVEARDTQWVDYHQIIADLKKDHRLQERINAQDLDEVWVFAYPYAGFYESIMAGGYAFECNSNPLQNTDEFTRRFVIMGFSYERWVGEMLEDFCHRAEVILNHIYRYARGDANLYGRFIRYDKVAPGKAEIGTVHYAPNSIEEYQYDNNTRVSSSCDDWLNFPHFKGERRLINCEAWDSDPTSSTKSWIRMHHNWWLSHLPKVVGRTDGVANNWWKYIVDPNRV